MSSRWVNGDFDYNGKVNFDDYTLIDVAFNSQSGTLSRAIAWLDGSNPGAEGMTAPALRQVERDFAQFGAPYSSAMIRAVPEPMLGTAVITLVSAGTALRRGRSHD